MLNHTTKLLPIWPQIPPWGMNTFGRKQHSQLVKWRFKLPNITWHWASPFGLSGSYHLKFAKLHYLYPADIFDVLSGDPQGCLHIRNSFLGSKIVASQYDRITNICILAHSAKVTVTFRLSITWANLHWLVKHFFLNRKHYCCPSIGTGWIKTRTLCIRDSSWDQSSAENRARWGRGAGRMNEGRTEGEAEGGAPVITRSRQQGLYKFYTLPPFHFASKFPPWKKESKVIGRTETGVPWSPAHLPLHTASYAHPCLPPWLWEWRKRSASFPWDHPSPCQWFWPSTPTTTLHGRRGHQLSIFNSHYLVPDT